MTRRRSLTTRTLDYTREARSMFTRAAFGRSLTSAERDWLQAVYDANRRELVENFEERRTFLSAWPVSEFDADSRIREDAAQLIAVHRRQEDEFDIRAYLDPDRKDTQ